MRQLILTLCFVSGALPGQAEAPMTADEFDAYTRNKTFHYANQGQAYGAEEYLENRRVVWSFLGGDCQTGRWYPEGDMICFLYDSQPDAQCWSFTKSPGGLVAKFQNDPERLELYEIEKSPVPMNCSGPEVGA